MVVTYNFKTIQPVPTNKDIVDIVLTKVIRGTPTVVHSGWKISRIRSFYMRKVKFTQQNFHEKFSFIIDQFPKLDDIHPFYADLVNVLYDKDHYKLALGQINTARQIVDNISKDYVRLLKFGDSLFRCKQLKRAALGRMCTVMRKLGPTLVYLEEVRKHMARLPSIDPSTRTLLVCGFPNVGKSSFMNKVTRADVEVQPYAGTTKSLFVGHMDHIFQRWQVIDTPGILDHPLEDRNTIEMQSITALAHLQCAVLFFLDISGECGYTVEQQTSLFRNISPLFANKPLMVVATKIDRKKVEDLDAEERAMIDDAVAKSGAIFKTMSNITDVGIADVKNAACDALLARRVEAKMRGKKVSDVLNRLNVTAPKTRDLKLRPVNIPASVVAARAAAATATTTSSSRASRVGAGGADLDEDDDDDDDDDEEVGGAGGAGGNAGSHVRRWLERDRERAAGGPGRYSLDLSRGYMLREDEWKTDIIPEILDGKNIVDFVERSIVERFLALEAEEEALQAASSAAGNEEWVSSEEDEEEKELFEQIQAKKASMIDHHRSEKAKNRSVVPRKFQHVTESDMRKGLLNAGFSASVAVGAAAAAAMDSAEPSRGRKRNRGDQADMDDDDNNTKGAGSRGRRGGAAVGAGAGGEDDDGDSDDDEQDGAARRRSSSRGGDDEDAMNDALYKKRVRSSSAVRARHTAMLGKFGGDAKAAERARISTSRAPTVRPAQSEGLTEPQRDRAIKDFKKYRSIKFHGKQGESDRRVPNAMPKWLYSGKRSNGKTDRR